MSPYPFPRFVLPLAVAAVVAVLAGCSAKQLSSSVQDQSLVTPPPVEVAEPVPEPVPEPIQEARAVTPEPIPEAVPPMEEPLMPEPMEEVVPPLEEALVAEPELEPELMEEIVPPLEEALVAEPELEPEPMEEIVPPLEEALVMEPELEPAPVEEVLPPLEEAVVAEPEPVEELVPPMEEALVAEPEPEPVPEPMEEPMAPEPVVVSLEDVYFDFDRFSLRHEAREVLEANAMKLKENGNRTITIEGHCDERGTEAYNLVLGERRAQAAKRYLEDLGIPSWQINTISYGKERPFCTDHSEECWQENRRAHFVD